MFEAKQADRERDCSKPWHLTTFRISVTGPARGEDPDPEKTDEHRVWKAVLESEWCSIEHFESTTGYCNECAMICSTCQPEPTLRRKEEHNQTQWKNVKKKVVPVFVLTLPSSEANREVPMRSMHSQWQEAMVR